MTPLPPPLGSGGVMAWRLDKQRHAATWDSGEGAYLAGGRWNSKGVRAVYCSLDPATAILEVAVHTGFAALDAVPHVLISAGINPATVHVVQPASIPDPDWLRPGSDDAAQRAFGDALLARHKIVALPSAVSTHSWNLIFVRANALGAYGLGSPEPFTLDARFVHPTTP
jgi:RES domain-containing protein